MTLFLFRFLARALEISQTDARIQWKQAKQRMVRRGIEPPPTTREKPPGSRQETPKIALVDRARAVRFMLDDPLAFFEDVVKLQRLKDALMESGGDSAMEDAELEVLRSERDQQIADVQSLLLPGLGTGVAASLRSTRYRGCVLGAIFDFLQWLGIEGTRDTTGFVN